MRLPKTVQTGESDWKEASAESNNGSKWAFPDISQEMFCVCFGIFKSARCNRSNQSAYNKSQKFQNAGTVPVFDFFGYSPLLFNLSGSSERGQKKTQQSAKILGEQEYAHQTHDKFA